MDIPREPGVYVLSSLDTMYPYPWSEKRGKSKVFYIGQSSDLRSRLMVHKKHSVAAKDNPDTSYDYYWPIYEYAAYHGCVVCCATCKSKGKAKETEESLMMDFANYFGARPVANGQSAWRQE
jgi:hypothetical protein